MRASEIAEIVAATRAVERSHLLRHDAARDDVPRQQLLNYDGYHFTRALIEDRPYFGPRMASAQGDARRHAYMAAVVAMLAKQQRSVNILEVGSWAGGSAITWARALERQAIAGRVVCVDHWQQYFDLRTNTAAVYEDMDRAASTGAIAHLFRHNIRASGVADRVLTIQGDTRTILPTLGDRCFDVVFVDGSHMYADVLADLRDGARLVSVGGVVCGDDLERQLAECPAESLQAAIQSNVDFLEGPEAGTGYHPGVTAAVAEVFGRVPVWHGFWALQRTPDGWQVPDIGIVEPIPPSHLTGSVRDSGRVDVHFRAGYSIFDADNRAIAVKEGLQPEDLLLVRREAWNRAALVLVGPTFDDVLEQIQALREAEEARDLLRETSSPVLVRENYQGFNIVRFRGCYYALSQEAGPVDLLSDDISQHILNRFILVAATEQDAMLLADGVAAKGAVTRVPTLEQQGEDQYHRVEAQARLIDELRGRLSDQEKIVAQERQRIAELEQERSARMAHVTTLLEHVAEQAGRSVELQDEWRTSSAGHAEAVRTVESELKNLGQILQEFVGDKPVAEERVKLTELLGELRKLVDTRENGVARLEKDLRRKDKERVQLTAWLRELQTRVIKAESKRGRFRRWLDGWF